MPTRLNRRPARPVLALTALVAALVAALSGLAPAAGGQTAEDHSAPQKPRGISVIGGEGWRRFNGFHVQWRNPRDDGSPIHKAHWKLCRADRQGQCRRGAERRRGIHSLYLDVPSAGDFTLRVYLEDAAGNQNPDRLSDTVHLRYDRVPPVASPFALPDPGDPRRLSLIAYDKLSGLLSAAIELRGAGEGWRSLGASLEPGGRISAYLPDLDLPDGVYAVRARVHDWAGNEAVSDTDAAGRHMTVTLPVRTRLRIHATAQVTRHVRRCRSVLRRVAFRRYRRMLVCHWVSVTSTVGLPGPVFVPFGADAFLSGAVATDTGHPVAGTVLSLLSRPRSEFTLAPVDALVTDGQGRFSYRLPAGPSRMLRLAHYGDSVLLPAALDGSTLVPAAATLAASRGLLRNGQAVLFSGRLLGGHVPAGGRTVALQAFFRGAWRTFATPRTNNIGAWRHLYRFGATRTRTTYRFRVLVPRETGHPFETGYSRVIAVTVLGR